MRILYKCTNEITTSKRTFHQSEIFTLMIMGGKDIKIGELFNEKANNYVLPLESFAENFKLIAKI